MRNMLALLMISLLVFGCAAQQPQSGQPPGGQSPVGTKFSDWRYYPMALQIAPGEINATTQSALNMFTVQQAKQPDGSLLITVTDSQDGTSNNFTLGTGQVLYFSDGNPGDDTPGKDGTLIDDHFVVVDSSGTIVQAYSAP